MKSFLLKSGHPVIKFSLLPDNTFYEGIIPEGFDLAICPSNEKQVILDVDLKNGKDGYSNIPMLIMLELQDTFNYKTKSGGAHYYLNYTGNKLLKNCATEYGLDLRIGANKATKNAGGYVKYNGSIPVKEIEPLIKQTSPNLNLWLEKLFS
jgi:hypothetical protein